MLATISYFVGEFPPGKHDPNLVVQVLKNELVAHAQIYHMIKALPHGKDAKIGLAKNTVIFDPNNQYNPIDKTLAYSLDRLWNQIFLEFMLTGKIQNPFPVLSTCT